MTATLPRAAVARLIERHLLPLTAGGPVRVDAVTLAYYDGGGTYLQPVYRFSATLRHAAKGAAAGLADDHVVGYVPVAAAPSEPVPQLSAAPRPSPDAAGGGPAPPPRTRVRGPRGI